MPSLHQVSKTGFRVLDTLSRSLGTELPISILREAIEQRFGTGHYKNVYEAVTQLTGAGYLRTEKMGRTKLVSLNLARMETVDLLAEIDLRSRRERREGALTMPPASTAITQLLLREPEVGTAFLVDAALNETLNRIELVVSVHHPSAGQAKASNGDGAGPPRSPAELHERLQEEARKANVRLDALLLTETEFKEGLSSSEQHPVQAQAKRRTALIDPQRFWWLVSRAKREGPEPRMLDVGAPGEAPLDLVSPLVSNPDRFGQHLERFGYTEMGSGAELVEEVCVEVVVAAALASDEPRRRYASAVLLAKNEVNPRLLAFLATKHDLADALLGMLEVLEGHPRAPGLEETRPFLPTDSEPADVDRDHIEELLDLYGATS